MQSKCFAVPAILLTAAVAFAADAAPKATTFTLKSPAFSDGGKLPVEFTCDGQRASPPLEWTAPPERTKSLAIVMHHTPGPGDTHVYLLLYNIPADARKLDKNAKNLGTFGVNTVNDKPEYTPPCSKGPGEKKYTLTIYALSDTLKFDKPDVTLEMLLGAMKDKTLATSAINVTYERMGQGDGEHHGPPRGGPPELQRAIESLKLTPEQQAKVDTAVQQFREKQEAAKSELLKQLKGVLSADQFEKVESSFKRPPPPPPSAPDEAR